jgi:23S rRNA pseudouridine1911/1915/1917 synthase
MVVDMPAGMLVIPTIKDEKNTLTAILNNALDMRGEEVNAYPCHRIDRETSGLIIYAKGKKAQQLMMEEFKKKAVRKVYIAFVHGRVRQNADVINRPIYNKKKRRDEPAITQYRVTGRRKDFTILEVEPITGRTNQIRIHLKGIGHPLVGESVYAFRKDFELKFKRVALHAHRLKFIHPVTKEALNFTSELPKDMEDFLKNRGEIACLPARQASPLRGSQ